MDSNYKLKLDDFFKFRQNEELFNNSREKAYEDCRIAYIKACEGKCEKEDLAKAIHYFLLSWGMGRNCKILNTYYPAFLCLADELISEGKKDGNLKKGVLCKEKVMKLGESVKNALKEEIVPIFESNQDVEGESAERGLKIVENSFGSISDVFASKILLGTTGCIIAYDDHVTKRLKYKTFNDKSVEDVMRIISENKEELEHFCGEINNLVGRENVYTPMRALDICLWSK